MHGLHEGFCGVRWIMKPDETNVRSLCVDGPGDAEVRNTAELGEVLFERVLGDLSGQVVHDQPRHHGFHRHRVAMTHECCQDQTRQVNYVQIRAILSGYISNR